MKKHLFLSYNSLDRTIVSKLRDDLIATGESVYWDQDLVPGSNYKTALRQAMHQAYAVLACFSNASVSQERSGVYPELYDAIDIYRQVRPGETFIFPVRFDDCELPFMEISTTTLLSHLQWVDLFPRNQWIVGVQRLVQALSRIPGHP